MTSRKLFFKEWLSLLIVAVTFCPGAIAQEEAPDVVAKKFIDAGNSGDRETFLSLLTEKARESFGAEADLSGEDGFESYTIRETKIEDDIATVTVDAMDEGKEMDVTLRMRQENAAWRVFGMDIDLGDGLVMKMDLEQIGNMLDSMAESMGESMAESMEQSFSSAFETSPEEIAAQRAEYDALQAVSASDYEGRWKNADGFEGKTLMEAITAIAESLGLGVHAGEHAEALNAAVSVDTSGLSKLEAMERIAAGAGLHILFPDPQYPGGAMMESMVTALAEGMSEMMEGSGLTIEGSESDDAAPAGTIQFAAGERQYPILFTGPFAVEIAGIQENAPHTTGSLMLAIRAYGLGASLLALLETDSEGTYFDPITDSQGRLLMDPDIMHIGGGMSDGVRYADVYTMELRNLIREVTSIAQIAGIQRVQLPTAVVELTFDDLSEGATASSDGITGTITSSGDYLQLTVTTPGGLDTNNVSVLGAADDAEGNAINISYISATSWQEGEIELGMSLDKEAAKASLKLVSAKEVHEYPFAFANVPLLHADEQAEKVEELSFEGEFPLTVEYQELIPETESSFGSIKVRVNNHSNKDAESVSLNLVYLDGSGNEIDDFPGGLSGEYVFEDGEMVSKPCAPKNSTTETETTAFGMPEGTEGVAIDVTSVDFIDGTSWAAESEW